MISRYFVGTPKIDTSTKNKRYYRLVRFDTPNRAQSARFRSKALRSLCYHTLQSVAAVSNRRKITPNDILVVTQTREVAGFLREDMSDFARKSEKMEEEGKREKEKAKREKTNAETNGQGISSFFSKA